MLKISQAEAGSCFFYHHFDIIKDGEMITWINHKNLRWTSRDVWSWKFDKNVADLIDENNIRIQKVPCIGRCDNAPAAQVGKRAVDNATLWN